MNIRGRLAELDQVALVKEGGEIRDARRLLHVVGDDDDGVAAAQLGDQVLDARRGPRIERRGRLVHEQDLRIDGQGAGDAQPLLLPAGKAQGVVVQPVLDLVPQAGALQAGLDDRLRARPGPGWSCRRRP